MQDALSTTVTQAQSCITSTVKSQAHCIRGEIHSLGEIQRELAAQICERFQNPMGYYKGQVGAVLITHHVYILFAGSRTFPRGHLRRKSCVSFNVQLCLGYQDRYGTVECSSTAKIIRIYQLSTDNEEAILKVSVYYNLIRWNKFPSFL